MKIFNRETEIHIKFFSFILGTIIWIYIMGELGYTDLFFQKNSEAEKEKLIKKVPVCVLYKPSGFKKVVDVSPAEIDVLVHGKGENLNNLTVNDIMAYVDVSNFVEGDYFVMVKVVVPNNVSLVGDIKTTKVSIKKRWYQEDKVQVPNIEPGK